MSRFLFWTPSLGFLFLLASASTRITSTSAFLSPAARRSISCYYCSEMSDFDLKDQRQNADQSVAASAVEFARICGMLKSTPRTGWVYRNVPNPESVADHSWRVASLCLLLQEGNNGKGIDIAKAMEMAIVHDLAEAITGDIAPGDNISKEEKQRLEHEAIGSISKLLARATNSDEYPPESSEECTKAETSAFRRLLSVIEEYEQRKSEEAIAVKDLDLLDMIVQADEYERAHPQLNLQEFFDGTGVERFKNAAIRRIAEEVHKQRTQRKELENVSQQVKPGRVPLSSEDLAFAQEFGKSSGMSTEDVQHVVRALRERDAAKLRKDETHAQVSKSSHL